MHRAATGGHTELVRLLLQSGAIVDLATEALCSAAELGHIEVVRVLLEHGAPVNSFAKVLLLTTWHFFNVCLGWAYSAASRMYGR